jgi:ribosome-binding factor A
MITYCYIFQSSYGSPEVDETKPKITKVEVSKDSNSARLWVDGLEEGHIHELTANGVRDADGESLLHPKAYYTLNYIPAK